MRRVPCRSIPALFLTAALAAASPAGSAPPGDTLAIGKDIADLITLDPAHAFELTAVEIFANVYDRLTATAPGSAHEAVGGIAESHAVSRDGRTLTFRLRDGLRFHSGNPVRPEDVEFSLERAVTLGGTPSFILAQLGWTRDNVEERIEVVDDRHVRVAIAEPLSPGLVLNLLSSDVASVLDRELVLSHGKDGDLGAAWLATNSAGSGPFRLGSWEAGHSVVLEADPNYRGGAPVMRRVVLRHEPDPLARRRLLSTGEVDLARDLPPGEIGALRDDPAIAVDDYRKGTVIYLAANAAHPILRRTGVVDALRHAVDYRGMAEGFLADQFAVHQAFWPAGLWAGYSDTRYRLDLAKARSLLAGAGHGKGFPVRLDTLSAPPFPEIARSIRTTLARIGIEVRITTREGARLWPLYRARGHELILAHWSPDYLDPHSNADAFARNPDNRLEANLAGVLAWRNAWAREDVNALVTAARDEPDPARRERLYLDLQRRLQGEGPYVFLFQKTEQVARRANVRSLVSDPRTYRYRHVTK